jgi:hypothetical protein
VLVHTTGSIVLSGYFHLTLEGHSTPPTAFDASRETWQSLCNICVVWGTYSRPVCTQTLGDMRHSEPLQWKTFSSYTTRQRTTGRSPFLSRSGPYPVLTACCDKINAEACSAGTLRSALSSDPLITVPLISYKQQHNIEDKLQYVINGVRVF